MIQGSFCKINVSECNSTSALLFCSSREGKTGREEGDLKEKDITEASSSVGRERFNETKRSKTGDEETNYVSQACDKNGYTCLRHCFPQSFTNSIIFIAGDGVNFDEMETESIAATNTDEIEEIETEDANIDENSVMKIWKR